MVSKMVFRERILTSLSLQEVAAGSYRHIPINSKRVYRGRGPQSLAGDYVRSFEQNCAGDQRAYCSAEADNESLTAGTKALLAVRIDHAR